jgi:hypothetical protein
VGSPSTPTRQEESANTSREFVDRTPVLSNKTVSCDEESWVS